MATIQATASTKHPDNFCRARREPGGTAARRIERAWPYTRPAWSSLSSLPRSLAALLVCLLTGGCEVDQDKDLPRTDVMTADTLDTTEMVAGGEVCMHGDGTTSRIQGATYPAVANVCDLAMQPSDVRILVGTYRGTDQFLASANQFASDYAFELEDGTTQDIREWCGSGWIEQCTVYLQQQCRGEDSLGEHIFQEGDEWAVVYAPSNDNLFIAAYGVVDGEVVSSSGSKVVGYKELEQLEMDFSEVQAAIAAGEPTEELCDSMPRIDNF